MQTEIIRAPQREAALVEQQFRISKNAKRMIWVTFQQEGIHCYPAAAKDPKLNTAGEYDVSFLANPHRHIFHFRVSIEVTHDDRDIEFIQFKRWLQGMYSGGTLELDFKSCEMMAEELYHKIAHRYPDRDIEISVSEDDENGCNIRYNTTMPTHNMRI